MADNWPEWVLRQGLEWSITASEAMDVLSLLAAASPLVYPMPEPSDMEIPDLIQERMYALGEPIEPAAADTMVAHLTSAGDRIAWNSAALTKAKDALEIWTGSAADNFGEYLTDMHGAAINLKGMMVGLAKVTEAYSGVVRGMQNDLRGLVEKHSAALHEAHLNEFRVGLAVVAAIPAIIGSGGLGGLAGAMLIG